MSSSQARSNGGERMVHQDFIARIRYSNALPPPPHPPKLLDIPNTGLASGQYTTPGFASRLAREQPLNIEADAELGMPLDLVGMPGVFDGDESSIQAPAEEPPPHPHDRHLLRTLASLGKNTTADTSSSFLRRIESGALKARPDPRITARQIDPFLRKRPEKRKASPEPDKGTPAWIKRRIEASFEVAARNLADKTKVRHPTKRNVKVVDSYPLIPDLDAFPDSGAYVTVKFSTGPVASGDRYDTRLLAGIFKPIERSTAEDAAYATALEAHERDPASNPKPHNMMSYDLFLPKDADTGDRFRQCFDVDNPDRDDPALYPPKGFFGFPRLRPYETSQEKEMDHETKYNEEVILAFREDNEVQGGKVVFYYPVMQRSTIRNQRTKNIARTIGITDDDELPRPDELHVTVSEPSEALKKDLANLKNDPLGYSLDQDEEAEEDEDAEGGANANGHGPPVPNGHQSTQPAAASDEDLDAEGDDD